MPAADASVSAESLGVLASLLRELRVPVTALSPLVAHAAAVEADADRLGLVGPADRGAVMTRHTGDSLLFALVRAPIAGERWVDVGSGAGFPGLPLACCYPDTEFLLVEPQSRRAGFLEVQVANLGLANAKVATVRSTAIAPGFDVATARALAEPMLALEALERLIEPDGTALVAIGLHATIPPNAKVVDVRRPGVDSPGRVLMIAHDRSGA